MARRVLRIVTAVVASLVLIPPVAAQAQPATTPNAVITWNIYAQDAIYEVARQPPYVTGRSFAMVQGAVYDAVNAIAGTPYEPYLLAPRTRGGESVDAAVAA
ncbi:MAG: PA-phosphatase, partial [Actinoplanes sp.]